MSSTIVTAVTAGPAPGPENVTTCPVALVSWSAFVDTAEARQPVIGSTNAGPTHAPGFARSSDASATGLIVPPSARAASRSAGVSVSIPHRGRSDQAASGHPVSCSRIASFSAASRPPTSARLSGSA